MATATKDRAAMLRRIEAHGLTLLAIFPNAIERDPVKLCKRLRRIEAEGAAFALRLCNGPEFASEDEQEAEHDRILGKARHLLQPTGGVAFALFLNQDPRGYALKIEGDWLRQHRSQPHPAGVNTDPLGDACRTIHCDWGGYGIIAPDLSQD